MKNHKFLGLICLLLITAVACKKDFLERSPLDKISDANYWKTPTDLKLYINSLYNRNDLLAREDGWGSIGPYGWDADNGSDTQVSYTYNTRMNGEKTISDDNDGWGVYDWAALRSINYFLDNYKKVEEQSSFDAVKPYVGEALFFRASFYFSKLKRYGDLPWAPTTVTVDAEILYGERTARNIIATNIIADLDNAISYLPSGASGWTGRLTKETALALQTRIALYEGTWEKYHAAGPFQSAANESQKFLEKAASAADLLIKQSESLGYPSLDNVGQENGYRDLFNQENYASSKEILFWRKYETGAITSIWDRYSANGAGRGATKNLIDSYLKADGSPVAANYDDSSLLSIAQDRDPRLEQTIQINDKKHYRWEKAVPAVYFIAPTFDAGDAEGSSPTGYQTYKGHNFRYAIARPAGQGLQALIYYRYGEVLLSYAEAKAELGTLTQADLDRSINKLRQRVAMPPLRTDVAIDPNFEFANLTAIIQAVRRERKVELACEGFRVDDIFRWAAAAELIVGKVPVGAKKAQWLDFKFTDFLPESQPDLGRQLVFTQRIEALETDNAGYISIYKNTLNGGTQGYRFRINRDYLDPIPTNQLTLNPKLNQNPGW